MLAELKVDRSLLAPLDTVGDDEILVPYHEDYTSERPQYICLETLRRPKCVVQLKVSIAEAGSLPAGPKMYVSPSTFRKIMGSAEEAVHPLTLGCDPEFYLLVNGQLANASRHLPFAGKVGSDGFLGEIRPGFATDARDLVNSLRSLILQLPRRVEFFSSVGRSRVDFQAHSCLLSRPAGFHVHLGLPKRILEIRNSPSRHPLNYLVRCLDWYVMVPLSKLDRQYGRRLLCGQYGKPGDYRHSSETLEYRTPGGFFLRSPNLAYLLLAMTDTVVRTLLASIEELEMRRADDRQILEAMMSSLKVPAPGVILSSLDPDSSVGVRRIRNIVITLSKSFKDLYEEDLSDAYLRAEEDAVKCIPSLLTNWEG